MKILTVVGARPQFIKAAPVSFALRAQGYDEFLLHTGQHYDYNMSQVFFDELGIPKPALNLEIGSGAHGQQTGQMLIGIEKILQEQQPDCLVVYGDTNSTIAGALAAIKLKIPVAHVEAGLRSFNRSMPEEHNRVLTDHCADLLFCPTQTAVDHLANEGISQGVHLVGDTMVDALNRFSNLAMEHSKILTCLQVEPKQYLLATIHRPYNTDIPQNLSSLLTTLAELGEQVIFPIHPRTRQKIHDAGLDGLLDHAPNLHLIEPVGYLDMIWLEQNARMILTDSGGIQKEAYVFAVPCITLRPETEWVETVATGWNVLTHTDTAKIKTTVSSHLWPLTPPPPVFGDGSAGVKIVQQLASKFVY